MSDGPHRSLPMRRHWKDTAERAARPVHSSAEVCNALTHALKRDILEAPIEKMRDILNSRKPDLFHSTSLNNSNSSGAPVEALPQPTCQSIAQ